MSEALRAARANMIDAQVRAADVTDPRIHAALAAVAREKFVPRAKQALAYADPASRSQPAEQNSAVKPVAVHAGWIVQVGALDSESEALQRIDAARNQAHGLLAKADPFTEPVVAKGDKKLYRARFAGLDRDQAEAVCKTLKRSDISCMTIRN